MGITTDGSHTTSRTNITAESEAAAFRRERAPVCRSLFRPGIKLIATALVTAFSLASAQAAADALDCAPHSKSAEVRVTRTALAGVPAIVRVPPSVSKPPIVLWHGFGVPASEAAMMNALPLDDVPAIKVYLGLPLFGTRAPPGPHDSVATRQSEDYALRLFEPAVVGAVKELPSVVAALRKGGCMKSGEAVGLFGFSAGGAAVLIALADHDVPVRAAVTVNAPTSLEVAIEALERATKRPFSWTSESRALAFRADAVKRAADIVKTRQPPALLLFHGADDTVITPIGATSLYQALQPLYERAGVADRLEVVIAPGVSHDWSKTPVLASLRASVADWFNRQPGQL